ncbi:High mobility group box 1, partial [Goodea atripinnis]
IFQLVSLLNHLVSAVFQALSPSEKKRFEDMAKADKVRYNREMSDYVPPKGFGKRGRKRKDPNAPKRPPSAFFVFCSEYRPSVKQQYPGLSIGDCAKKLGEMWSKLTQSEKQPYEEKAQKLREKYDRVRPQNGTELSNQDGIHGFITYRQLKHRNWSEVGSPEPA